MVNSDGIFYLKRIHNCNTIVNTLALFNNNIVPGNQVHSWIIQFNSKSMLYYSWNDNNIYHVEKITHYKEK